MDNRPDNRNRRPAARGNHVRSDAGFPPDARRARRNPLPLIAAAVVALALIAAAGAGLARCIDNRQAVPPEPDPPYQSPYDWSNLAWDGERATYLQDGQPASRFGIDVSVHQHGIDWPAVAADGVDFAFIRVGYRGYTEGVLHVDDYFEANLAGAREAGIDVGAYFFSQAITPEEAVEEADFVIAQLGGRPLDLPVAFDHEPISEADGRADGIDPQTLTACAEAFCARIEEAGYDAMIYGNAQVIAMCSGAITDTRPVWLAEYHALAPTAQFDFAIWQYSSTGHVAGIETDVDLNIIMPATP